MLKKMLISCLYLILVLVILCTNVCYATAVAITNENLKQSLQDFVLSSANELDYDVTMSNDFIKITSEDHEYNLNYDLTNKPIFSIEVLIENGMPYDEFEKKIGSILSPFRIVYASIASMHGVHMEDSAAYFAKLYLENLLANSLKEESFTFFDTSNVFEYVNDMYKEKTVISDSTSINSFLFTTERTDITDSSCKLVYELSINPEADFSKIIGFIASNMHSDITKENADFVVTLKVGQKCKIETAETIMGSSFSGYNCIEFNNKERTEFTAKSVGIKNGFLYIGEERTKKTIYITVEENTENASLETITLNLDSVPEVKPPESNDEEENPEVKPPESNDEEEKQEEKDESKTEDGTQTQTPLSNAGSTNRIYYIIGIMAIASLILYFKNKKYKDIK